MKYDEADVIFLDSVKIPQKPISDFRIKNFNSLLFMDDSHQRSVMHFDPCKAGNRFKKLQQQCLLIIPITDKD